MYRLEDIYSYITERGVLSNKEKYRNNKIKIQKKEGNLLDIVKSSQKKQ